MPMAQAEQIVFGSFKSADNARNWAQKLSLSLGQEIGVEAYLRDGTTWHRVTSTTLSPTDLELLARRADAAGINHWRLHAVEPAPTAVAPEREPLSPRSEAPMPPRSDAPSTASVIPARPLQAPARLTPPSGIVQTLEPGLESAQSHEFNWQFGVQSRAFTGSGVIDGQRVQGSLSLEAEYYRGWQDDRASLTFVPFVRWDSADADRSHADVRELYYSLVGESWDLHAGVRRVFWGVTEFHHLIDVINQTDLVENIDAEDKLGQPMVQLSMVRDWGLLDAFVLPGFRERNFVGDDERLGLPWALDDARYESGAEELRTDFALRWSQHFGALELGIHHFSGTSREPLLLPHSARTLQPYYPVIDQTGIDAQAFVADWAFKLEGFSRSGFGERYAAVNLGLERTLSGVFESAVDLGVVVEYMYDERGDEAFNTLFENDIALGGRLQMNDFANTQALLGLIYDHDTDDLILSLEASRELSQHWLLSVEGRGFFGNTALPAAPLTSMLLDPRYKGSWFRDEDYIQLELRRFF
ncbi:MAG: SPOR domain-containing protein [Pseudomonadota bacterium]